MTRTTLSSLALLVTAAMLTGCGTMQHANQWEQVDQAIAVMHPTEGNNARGTVLFTKEGDRVRIVADIMGLQANGTHAIHVHQYGDCSAADGTSAGGHYNPENHPHALPTENHARHAGDFGNLVADGQGRARKEMVVDNLTIADLQNPVIGRAVIIHADSDKGRAEQPTGAAGARIACGVIGVANPQRH